MSELDDLRDDLLDEQQALDVLVAHLDEDQWHLATPSPGWTVADQIGHLAYFDEAARTAVLSPERFRCDVSALFAEALERGLDEATLAGYRAMTSAQLLATWREHRRALADAARTLDESTRVEWYGPSMSARSFVTARLMETWAHGTDVANALGVALPATNRLRHIARLGVITRAWSYQVRGEEPPSGRVRVVLSSPSRATWSWGDEDAEESVEGSAEEFCLVVTQRRHLDDTSLITGKLGRDWLLRAQAFAGGPSEGPAPRSNA